MKILLFFAVLVHASAAAGQDRRNDSLPPSKWILGVSVSPDIKYRTLQDMSEGSHYETFLNDRNEWESYRFGATAGIHVNYFFSPSFALGTGVFYSMKGFGMDRLPYNAIVQHPNDPFIPVARSFEADYRFLDVPFQAVVLLGKGRLRSISSIGLVYNIHLNTRLTNYYEYADGRIEHAVHPAPKDYRPFMLSAAISSGVDYQWKENLHLRIEPNFRHAIFSTERSYMFKQYLWNAGVNFGMCVDL